MGHRRWAIGDEPSAMAKIYEYAVTFHAGNFYYFGGYGYFGRLDSILRLNADSWTWSNVGKLNSARLGHSVILIENKFMVIGGSDNQPNEACVLNDGQFSCTEQPNSLTDYRITPILFLVNKSYGDC